jgi:dolichol kinase
MASTIDLITDTEQLTTYINILLILLFLSLNILKLAQKRTLIIEKFLFPFLLLLCRANSQKEEEERIAMAT